MDGKTKPKCFTFQSEVGTLAERARLGFPSKNDAWFALTATTVKTKHPMAMTALTKKSQSARDCSSLQPLCLAPQVSKEWAHFILGVIRRSLI